MFNSITYRITIGINKDRDGRDILPSERNQAIARIARGAASIYGGYTIASGCGGWIGPDGELVEERCIVLTIHVKHPGRASSQAAELDTRLIMSARSFGRDLWQHSVVIERCGQSAIVQCD